MSIQLKLVQASEEFGTGTVTQVPQLTPIVRSINSHEKIYGKAGIGRSDFQVGLR